MEKVNYRKRIEALGYNMNQWSKVCRVGRPAITKHWKKEESGDIDLIPGPFWVILEMIENLEPGDRP